MAADECLVCSCHMAMRGRDQNIHRHVWKDISSYAPRIICRWLAPPQPIISMFCAGNSAVIFASRLLVTPKSLLRHKACVSNIEEMGPETSFHRVLDERDTKVNHGKAKRVVMCSGKVYFDLAAKRDEQCAGIQRSSVRTTISISKQALRK